MENYSIESLCFTVLSQTLFSALGYVPGGSKIDLKISFTPVEYCTAQMQFQLMVSQFNGKPLSCSVTGTCMPGLGKE